MDIEKQQKPLGGRRGFEAWKEASEVKDAEFNAKVYRHEEPETVQWIEEHIQSIDLNELNQIYAEIAQKSGVQHEDVNHLSSNRIYIVSGSDLSSRQTPMEYSPALNGILVNGDLWKLLLKRLGKKDLSLLVFRSLTHEMAHVTGALFQEQHIINGSEGRPIPDRRNEEQIGYARSIHRMEWMDEEGRLKNDHFDKFTLLNEGMTEEIAGRAMREYLRRRKLDIGGGEITNADYEEYARRSPVSPAYKTAQRFVDRIAERIAEVSGMPKDVVWNAFIGDYYKGIGIPEDLFDETIGSGFSAALAAAQTTRQLAQVGRKYSFPPVTPSVLKRWRSRI